MDGRIEIGVAVFMFVSAGYGLAYFLHVRPLLRTIVSMKRQGFELWDDVSRNDEAFSYPQVREE